MEASSSMTLPARNPRDVVAAVSPAFEGLFRAEYARVVGIAHRVLADQGEAEDVAQDVFLSFYRGHPADAPYARAWLHAAAAHAALNALRGRSAAMLALRYAGLSYAEIAAALDVRASSVGTLLRRAEDAFRRELR